MVFLAWIIQGYENEHGSSANRAEELITSVLRRLNNATALLTPVTARLEGHSRSNQTEQRSRITGVKPHAGMSSRVKGV